jgi:chorismate mutase/prephenate dehydratase
LFKKEKSMKQHIHIVGGTGQMGTWLTTFLGQHGYVITVSDKHKKDTKSIEVCDLLIVCVPIQHAPEVISKTLRTLKPEAAIIDLSSLMSLTEPILQQASRPAAFIHFLFGPSVPSLENQHIIINILQTNALIKELLSLFSEQGAILHELSGKEHDLIMAHIQALTQFSNLSLAKTLFENNIGLLPEVTTPTFLNQTAVITRVLMNNSAELLTNIQLYNPYVLDVLKKHIHIQEDFLLLLESKREVLLTQQYEALQQLVAPLHQVNSEVKEPVLSYASMKGATVAFLGPEGTFSHQAAKNITNNKATLLAKDTIQAVFESVASEECTYGLVAAENSTEGAIRETLDYLRISPVMIQGTYTLAIHQNLLSEESSLDKITTLISHPQNIAQTEKWIQTYLPTAQIHLSKNSVSDIQEKRSMAGVGFIGSDIISKLYTLPILTRHIEDNKNNLTKYYIITRNSNVLPVPTSRTLLFLTVYNRVGILKDMLSVIASLNIDVHRIESRPSQEKAWDYCFYIEVDIPRDDKQLDQVISLLQMYCPQIKVLGSV